MSGDRYRPATAFSITTIVLMIMSSLLLLVTGFVLVLGRSHYPAFDDPSVEPEGLGEMLLITLNVLSQWAFLLIAFGAVVTFLMWQHRAHRNARALGAENLTFTAASCVWWWFVPIGNATMPYKAMREIFEASRQGGVHTRETDQSILGFWWTSLSVVVLWVVFETMFEDELSLMEQAWSSVAFAIVTLIAAILAAGVIRAVDRGQARQAGG